MDIDLLIQEELALLPATLTSVEEADFCELIRADHEILKLQGQLARAIEHRRELINSRNLNKNPKLKTYFSTPRYLD